MERFTERLRAKPKGKYQCRERSTHLELPFTDGRSPSLHMFTPDVIPIMIFVVVNYGIVSQIRISPNHSTGELLLICAH